MIPLNQKCKYQIFVTWLKHMFRISQTCNFADLSRNWNLRRRLMMSLNVSLLSLAKIVSASCTKFVSSTMITFGKMALFVIIVINIVDPRKLRTTSLLKVSQPPTWAPPLRQGSTISCGERMRNQERSTLELFSVEIRLLRSRREWSDGMICFSFSKSNLLLTVA